MTDTRSAALKITLVDDVSKPARTVAQALKDAESRVKDMAKAMSNTGASDKLVKSLAGLKLSAKDIQTVAGAWKDYSKSAGLAADATKWTKAQAADVKAWESQTVKSLREVKQEQQRFFKAQAEAEKRARETPRSSAGAHVARRAVAAAAALGAGGGVEGGIHHAVREAAEVEQQRFRIRELSRKDPAEARQADALAAEIARQYPSITTAKALDNYVELRGNSVGENGMIDPAVARRNAFAAARAQNAATALGFDMSPQDMQNLLKGVEGSGRASDPKAVEKITDAYIRAKQVFGSAIASSMVRDYVANAKSANFSVGDDQFYLDNMVRMSEGNASRLGNEVNQTLATIAGGSMKKAAGKWLTELGLAKEEDMESVGGGNVRFKNGVKGHDVLETNQGEWAKTTLKEAIEHKGVVSEDKVAARMAMLRAAELKNNPGAKIDEHFLRERAEEGLISAHLAKAGFRTTVSDNLAHLIGNERLITRDKAALKNASGLEAGERLAENASAAMKELTASLSNFAGVVGSPAMKDAGFVLDGFARGVASVSKSLADWSKDNPLQSKIASWSTLIGGSLGGLALLKGGFEGLTGGFGLKGSATALDGSAAALTAAAGRLGAPGGVPKLGTPVAAGAVGGGTLGVGATIAAAAVPVAAAVVAGVATTAVLGGIMLGLKAIGVVQENKGAHGRGSNGPGPMTKERQAEIAAGRRAEAHHMAIERQRRQAAFDSAGNTLNLLHGTGGGWQPPSKGGGGAFPAIDASKVDETKKKVDATQQSLDKLGAPVAVNVDDSKLDQVLKTVNAVAAGLAKIGSLLDSTSSKAGALKAKSAGNTLALLHHDTGHFGSGPVQDH